MIDYTRYYRAYADMKQTLSGDYAHQYITTVMRDADEGKDELSGNAYNRVIDMEWVEMIEGKIPYIEKAIEEQRKFIEEYKEVDRIDKVKQVGKDAVQHLTQHANLIMAIEPNGDVIPERLLNTHREDSFATYENRFLHTLIFKSIDFVEARFRALQDAPNDSSNYLDMRRELTMNNQKFSFGLHYSSETHDRAKVDREEDISSLTDYERIERIRMRLDDFVNTDLIKSLKGCIAVKSPINKTNCIKQDPAFKQCYDLWVFIEAYRKTGYVLEKNVFEGAMPKDVQEEMYDVMAFQHFVATINTNKALKEKLHAAYVAENERRAREAERPEEELARYIEDKIYEARREDMALRLKEVREREVIIAKLSSELEQAKEQIRVRDVKIKELESMLNATKKELESTREELRKAQLRIMDLEAENEQLKARVTELEAQVAEMEAKIAAHQAEVDALNAKIAGLEATITELNSQIERLNEIIEEQAKALSQKDATIKEQTENIDTLNSQVSALTSTVGGLSAENSTLRNSISENVRTISAMHDEMNLKDAQIAQANSDNLKLTNKFNNLQKEFDDTVNRFSNFQQELDSLNATIADNKKDNEELQHQIRVHLNMLSAKDAIIATLNEEKSAMTERIEGVAAVEAAAAAEVRAARDKVAETETECVGLNNTVRAQVVLLTNREAEIKELKDKVYVAGVEKEAGIRAVKDECNAVIEELTAKYEEKIAQLEATAVAACNFSDDQKYTIRLNAEKKAIQKEYDAKLAKAEKRARQFVKKARVLVDDHPDKLLALEDANRYR